MFADSNRACSDVIFCQFCIVLSTWTSLFLVSYCLPDSLEMERNKGNHTFTHLRLCPHEGQSGPCFVGFVAGDSMSSFLFLQACSKSTGIDIRPDVSDLQWRSWRRCQHLLTLPGP